LLTSPQKSRLLTKKKKQKESFNNNNNLYYFVEANLKAMTLGDVVMPLRSLLVLSPTNLLCSLLLKTCW